MNPNGHKPSLLWKLNGHNIWKSFAWMVIKARSICEFRKILSKYIFSISHLKSVIFSTFQFILAQMSITSFISTQISTTLMIIHRSDDILFQSCDALKIHPTVVTNLAFCISPHNLSSCFFSRHFRFFPSSIFHQERWPITKRRFLKQYSEINYKLPKMASEIEIKLSIPTIFHIPLTLDNLKGCWSYLLPHSNNCSLYPCNTIFDAECSLRKIALYVMQKKSNASFMKRLW